MKRVIICALMFNAVQPLTAADVEAVMYLDTEMPCLQSELLSGRIVIHNHGEDEIKLLKRDPGWSDMLAHNQLYLWLDIPKEETMTDRFRTGRGMRRDIKDNVDYIVQNPEGKDVVTLKKGGLLEVGFSGRELCGQYHISGRRTPFVAELYLSPDMWIPVDVHPPIVVAFDAKFTPLSDAEAGSDREAARVTRVQIGTNEFLWAKAKSATRSERLADIHPDDTVIHSNKVITITSKDGTVRAIPEADIARVSAERKEAIRKNWPKEGNTP